MELDHYRQSGIIESYVLGLATSIEAEELQRMRRLYPEVNREIAAVERQMERTAFAEAVLPPEGLKDQIFQRISWREEIPGTDEWEKANTKNPNYTFINIQPKSQEYITVNKMWKYFFFAIFLISKILLFTAVYFLLKYLQSQEKIKELSAGQAHTVQQAPQ